MNESLGQARGADWTRGLAWLDSAFILPILLIVGVLIRLAVVFGMDVHPWSDAAWYYARASEMANGMGFQEGGVPTAFWPVGYPAFLAGLFAVFGPSVKIAQIANVVFWAASLWLIHRITLRLCASMAAANLAVLLYSIYLNALGYTGLLLTETLFVFLLLLAWWLTCRLDAGSVWRAVPLGVVLGLTTLVKVQTWLILPVWAVLVLVFAGGVRRAALARIALTGVVLFATVLPWSLRNLETFGTFVFVSSNGGVAFALGNHDNSNGSHSEDSNPHLKDIAWSVQDQIAADRRAKDITWRWIGEHPDRFLRLAPKKYWWSLVPDGESEWGYQAGFAAYEQYRPVFRALRWANQLIYFGLLAATVGCLGLMLLRLRAQARPGVVAWSFVGAYAVTFVVLTFVFNGQSRYHFPLVAVGCVLCGWTLAQTIARRARNGASTDEDGGGTAADAKAGRLSRPDVQAVATS
ncbi:ArnT family glycosyltransferase [Uliginosibacterium sp. sgz301328]|uniref:ArnT family glycosyltransferase n=1 Tax=Uliginosibacterium sp. sgz301328 TaxID=3243764 RepID=UPI00359CD97C